MDEGSLTYEKTTTPKEESMTDLDSKRPPQREYIGIVPRSRSCYRRADEILDGIKRRAIHGVAIPPEWAMELEDLLLHMYNSDMNLREELDRINDDMTTTYENYEVYDANTAETSIQGDFRGPSAAYEAYHTYVIACDLGWCSDVVIKNTQTEDKYVPAGEWEETGSAVVPCGLPTIDTEEGE